MCDQVYTDQRLCKPLWWNISYSVFFLDSSEKKQRKKIEKNSYNKKKDGEEDNDNEIENNS